MLFISSQFYDLDLGITLIYLSFELINFSIYPIYTIKTCYLQLEKVAKKVTLNKTFAGVLRMLISFLKTPYCTGLGQVTSSIYQFITVNRMFNRRFVVNNEGIIKNRSEK